MASWRRQDRSYILKEMKAPNAFKGEEEIPSLKCILDLYTYYLKGFWASACDMYLFVIIRMYLLHYHSTIMKVFQYLKIRF